MVGFCGERESDNIFAKVTLTENEGIKIKIISKNYDIFGDQIKKTVEEVLIENEINSALVEIEDFGALDFAIRARVKTAINRAKNDMVVN